MTSLRWIPSSLQFFWDSLRGIGALLLFLVYFFKVHVLLVVCHRCVWTVKEPEFALQLAPRQRVELPQKLRWGFTTSEEIMVQTIKVPQTFGFALLSSFSLLEGISLAGSVVSSAIFVSLQLHRPTRAL